MTDLTRTAAQVRARLVRMSHDAKAGHLGSQLSCVDILVALYFGGVLKVDPKNPAMPDRDRFILSKGHAVAAQYVCLAMRGFFPEEELSTYGKAGSRLPEQGAPGCVPGLECATGSLGHGLGIGVGLALAAKIQKRPYRVFVVLGDGECNEGSVWEAAQFAAANKLDNLVAVIDNNWLQGIGDSSSTMGDTSLFDKFEAFGWSAWMADGHDYEMFLRQLTAEVDFGDEGKPRAVVAVTTKGKGVSFLEGTVESHYRIPTSEEVEAAEKELGA